MTVILNLRMQHPCIVKSISWVRHRNNDSVDAGCTIRNSTCGKLGTLPSDTVAEIQHRMTGIFKMKCKPINKKKRRHDCASLPILDLTFLCILIQENNWGWTEICTSSGLMHSLL